MPRFGGYDPIGVARGVAVAGDPRLWILAGERLYLFYTPRTATGFAGGRRTGDRDRRAQMAVGQLTLAP